MVTQPDLFQPTVTSDDKSVLRTHLYAYGWQTRKQICRALGWTERKVRNVAEAMGADIVRGQAGFKLTIHIQRDSQDVALAIQARDAAIAQGKRMIRYGVALGRRLHAIVE